MEEAVREQLLEVGLDSIPMCRAMTCHDSWTAQCACICMEEAVGEQLLEVGLDSLPICHAMTHGQHNELTISLLREFGAFHPREM